MKVGARMSSETVYVEKELIERMRDERDRRRWSQSKAAEILGISISKYSRLETGRLRKIERSLLNKIVENMKLDRRFTYDVNTEKKSYRLPADLVKDLQGLQKNLGFEHETDVVVYCLREYVDGFRLQQVQSTLEDFMKELIGATFIRAMKKMNREAEIGRAALELIEETTDINVESYKEKAEENMFKIPHAKAY